MMVWREQARELRAQGWKISDISVRFGKSSKTVSAACKGVDCPIDHKHLAGKAMTSKSWKRRKLGRIMIQYTEGADEA